MAQINLVLLCLSSCYLSKTCWVLQRLLKVEMCPESEANVLSAPVHRWDNQGGEESGAAKTAPLGSGTSPQDFQIFPIHSATL